MKESMEWEQDDLPLHWELLLYPLPLGLALILRLVRLGGYTTWAELAWAFRAVRVWRSPVGGPLTGTVTLWASSLGLSLHRLLGGQAVAENWRQVASLAALDPADPAQIRLLAPLWLTATLSAVVLAALLVVLLAFLAGRIWGARAGLLAGLFLAISPSFVARSRILGPDAVTAGLAVGALLALFWALQGRPAWGPLALSGLLAGLAFLNQGQAVVLLPYGLLILAVAQAARRRPVWARSLGLWLAAFAAGALLACPATWTSPLEAVRALLAQAGDPWRGAAQASSPVTLGDLGRRLAPLTLVGLALALLRLLPDPNRRRLPLLALLLFALLSWVLVPPGPADGHQALTALVALGVAGAVGLEGLAAHAVGRLGRCLQSPPALLKGALSLALLGGIGWQAGAIARFQPYFTLYRNPWFAERAAGQRPLWGEGNDRLAAYLNALPDGQDLCVAASDVAALAPFYAGRIVPLAIESAQTADIVVLQGASWQEPSPALHALRSAPRERVSLHGVECARIYANDIHRPLLELLDRQALADDVIVLDALSPFARHYAGPAEVAEVSVTSAEQMAARLDELAAGRWRLWHVAFDEADPQGIARDLLESHAVVLERHEVPGATVTGYILPLQVRFEPLTADQALDLEYPQGLRLTRAGLAEAQVQYRQQATLALEWQVGDEALRRLSISLRLRDSEGKLWAQRDDIITDSAGRPSDAWAGGATVTTVHKLAVPAGAPPGPYELRAVIYDAETQEPYVPNGPGGCCSGEVIKLLPLEVLPALLPPAPSELSIPQPLQVPLAPGLDLLGCEVGVQAVQTGQSIPLRLWWQATAPMTVTYQAHLMLVDAEGELRGERIVEPAGAYHPTTAWTEGEILEGRYSLQLPAEAACGEALLGVEIVAPNGEAGEPVRLGAVQVEVVEHSFTPPAVANPRLETLGQAVRLLGYDLDRQSLKPGEALRLTLYWQCLAPMQTSYTVFTHLLDPEGQMVCGHDSIPAGGARFTTGWVLHEVLTDPHDIIVPPDARPGRYAIEVGLYDADTGARLQAFSGGGEYLEGDRILLGEVEVVGD